MREEFTKLLEAIKSAEMSANDRINILNALAEYIQSDSNNLKKIN